MLKGKESIENNKVKLEIEVAAPDVDTALAKAYRQVVKKVNLPGFRKGKVPRRILESRFGPEILHEEALELLVPPAYDEALEEADIDPIGHPDFELVQIEEGKPLLFYAVIEVLPEVDLGEYMGIKAEQEEAVIDEIQVDHHLYMLREQNARLVPREEGTIKEGDIVMIDFKGYVDDVAFEGGEAENYSLEIGSNSFIPGFEQQLIGVAAGAETEVKVTFPDNYRKDDIAGKDAVFEVKVHQIKEKELPELNDEFVQEVSEFETLEAMKTDLKEKLQNNADDNSRSKLEEQLIEKVSALSKVEPPQTLVDRQIDRMIGDLESYLRYQGMNLDQFIEMSGKSREDMREDKREEAAERAKANLVLDAIAKKEGITADDSEIEAKIAEIAASYNDEPERIKTILDNQGRIPVMKEEIRIRKVIDLLVEKADITIVKELTPEKPKKAKKADKAEADQPEKEVKAKNAAKTVKAKDKVVEEEESKPKTAAKPRKTAAKKAEEKQEDGDKSES